MDKQIAHRHVGITQIRAEKRFAKVLNKLVPCGVTAEEFTALMPRTVKCAVALVYVVHQRPEERRAQLRFIVAGSGLQLAAIEGVTGFIMFEYARDPRQIFCRNALFILCRDKHGNTVARRINLIEFTSFNIIDG